MTFVAQPYERFADDLLTALTGGMIREEHLFTGTDAPYTTGAPGIVQDTLKVFGQRNEAYLLFDPGVDYEYNAANQAIVWKPQGKLPDDHSYFYVNYYLQETVPTLTDRNAGSVTATLAEAFARELAVLHRQMEGIYQSAFVDLATGTSLDHVVALLGLTRRDAKFATGEVVFKRTTPAPGDIDIPAATLVSTLHGQNFETTDKRTLRKGQLSVTVPMRAQVDGPPGKVDAGTIQNINRPIFGVESVVNDAATFFASQPETDEELRRRLQGTLERAGKATLDAIKYALIEDVPQITEANIQVTEQEPGLVEVKLGLDSSTPDLVQQVEDAIFSARPAGVRVTHNLPTQSAGGPATTSGISRDQAVADFTAQHEPPDTHHLSADVLKAMPDGSLTLRIEVFLRLAQTNLTAAQKENIEDDVRQMVSDYVSALPMGAPLMFNKLLGRLVAPDTILDASMLVGAESDGTFESFSGNLATDGRKAKIDAYHIFVGLMDETVNVDLTVTLEPKAGNQIDAGQTAPLIQEGGPLYGTVKTAIDTHLAGMKQTVPRDTLKAAVQPLVENAGLQIVQQQGVTLSAQYVETGRLLNNTDQVALEENEVPSLRRLTLTLKDNLNG